jgi:hypothetical protein
MLSHWYFDRQDKEILALVNELLAHPIPEHSKIFDATLHPHGIKNLVMSRITRIVYAVINLLTTLENGHASDRIMALRALYDEVLSSAQTTLRRNTARVLLQIMKDLVRVSGDEHKQLMLAHDFRKVAMGTPRIVRKLLARYHLPEMPEEWNQFSFDGHVYDAHSRGRKTPTHLIMDAWIKGLRFLTVVYDNYIDRNAASELLEAASIMGIHIRLGLEVHCPFRGRFINMVWIPRGFSTAEDFMEFLQTEKMRHLSVLGQEIIAWRKDRLLDALEHWNSCTRRMLEDRLQLPVPELDPEDFLRSVGLSQPSFHHLAESLHQHLLPILQSKAAHIRSSLQDGRDPAAAEALKNELRYLDSLTSAEILRTWLDGTDLPDITESIPPELPEMLTLPPGQMVEELTDLHTGSRICLDLAGLTVQDVIELIYDCGCGITHLEIFNLSNWYAGQLKDLDEINELQRVLNEGRGPRMKEMVHQIIDLLTAQGNLERVKKFQEILNSIPTIWEYYRKNPLKTRIGSQSQLELDYSVGMGFVYTDTLPTRAQKTLKRNSEYMGSVPVYTAIEERVVFEEEHENPSTLIKALRKIPGLGHAGKKCRITWMPSDTSEVSQAGNIATLGGITRASGNDIFQPAQQPDRRPGFFYLSTSVSNWIKVLVGFIPSVASFLYTQDWWFLAWFGTFIWFAITGVRNVIQMVVAGNGTTRTTLLRWKDHVNINRICDSLMYTGISVALLEVVVRVWLLEDLLGFTVVDDPIIVFTVLNFVNAIYICSHNIFRGFPREAAVGNLFRSALAIPVSSWYNSIFILILGWAGVADPLVYTVPSAAIISKLASDTVAAIIEGYADSQNNRRIRRLDYKSKIDRIFTCYTRLELLFPEKDILLKLARSGGLQEDDRTMSKQALETSLIINALDMMYFWFYLPRAQDALARLLRTMSQADRTVLARSQLVLLRERDISQLFVDGLVGKDFSRPMTFYLDNRKEYLHAILKLCQPGRDPAGKTLSPDDHGRAGKLHA